MSLNAVLTWCNREPELEYRYDNLANNEIRTLIIHPGRPRDPLRATIERHQLGDPSKPYTALSYVWGDSNFDRTLFVGEYTIRIKRSADVLLRRIRDKEQSKRIWIDAICINQNEDKKNEEKGQQVKLMGSIFSDANSVAIWMGESDRYTDSLFRAFHKWAAEKDRTLSTRPTKKRSNEKVDLRHLSNFTNRKWFHRAWTFQEACLSDKAELLCGTHRVTWRIFITAMLCLSDRGLTYKFGASSDTVTALAYFSAASPKKEVPLLSLLMPLTRKLGSQKPEDKVFSMLGMANKKNLSGITPDYTMSVAEVYTCCARAIIRQEGGLSVFSGTHGPQNAEKQGLPSWAPDWRLPRRGAYIHGFDWPRAERPVYQLNKDAPFANDVGSLDAHEPQSRYLALRGARIDHVDRMHKPVAVLKLIRDYGRTRLGIDTKVRAYMMWTKALMQALDEVCVTLGLLLPGEANGGNDKAREKATAKLLYALCANRVSNETVMTVTGFSYPDRESITEPSRLNPSYNPRGDIEWERERIDTPLGLISTFLQGRAVFRTRAGLVGIAPDYMQEGDQLWDLMGGEVPFVLRPAVRDEQDVGTKPFYKLVGESYVDDIMNGELWRPGTPENPMPVTGENLVFEDIELV